MGAAPGRRGSQQLAAPYGRAADRDYVDVDAVLPSGRYSSAELLRLAREADPGFDQSMITQALLAVDRVPDQAFEFHGLTHQHRSGAPRCAVRDRLEQCEQWSSVWSAGHVHHCPYRAHEPRVATPHRADHAELPALRCSGVAVHGKRSVAGDADGPPDRRTNRPITLSVSASHCGCLARHDRGSLRKLGRNQVDHRSTPASATHLGSQRRSLDRRATVGNLLGSPL